MQPALSMTNKTEYVYAIGHPHGYVKIGRSNDPQSRLKQHQTSCPYELWIIAQLPVEDSRTLETELHDYFEGKRHSGEWFELDYDDYDVITELMRMLDSRQEFESLSDYQKYRESVRRRVFA